MERTVIDEVAAKIGKTPSETWALIRSGLLTVDHRPRWTENGEESVDQYRITFTLGAKGNNN